MQETPYWKTGFQTSGKRNWQALQPRKTEYKKEHEYEFIEYVADVCPGRNRDDS